MFSTEVMSSILAKTKILVFFRNGKRDYSKRPFLTRKFWGWRGQLFFEKKNVFYEEIFRQNFLRKFRLEFSQPRKFYEEIWDHLIIELKSVPFPSTG